MNMGNSQELSPIMKLWHDIKSKHPDVILLFHCGKFYESFNMDAKECASILGITLTWENNVFPHNHETYDGAIAAFPYHALDTYLPKLIRTGKRIAIFDKLEDNRLTKKLVKKCITELVTPNKQ